MLKMMCTGAKTGFLLSDSFCMRMVSFNREKIYLHDFEKSDES